MSADSKQRGDDEEKTQADRLEKTIANPNRTGADAGQPPPQSSPDATLESVNQPKPSKPPASSSSSDVTHATKNLAPGQKPAQSSPEPPQATDVDATIAPGDVNRTNAGQPEITLDATTRTEAITPPNQPASDLTTATTDSLRLPGASQTPANPQDITIAPSNVSRTNAGRPELTAHGPEATLASQGGRSDEDEFLVVAETKSRDGLPDYVGRYRVKRLLGEGAFGKVYQAHDPQLDRLVAVKVAKSVSGETQVQRFLREARAAAQLRHPNIIPVYEYGSFANQNIIVYQFVKGETLKSYIRRNENLKLDEVVRILREIADGLNYAHENGIIHRDVKPDNILLDQNGRPHIADFGCARAMDDQTHLTIDGSILGTPMYMSPEQASGKAHIADGRTDIWSLGVMLYEMVSGEKPFKGQLTELLYWICNNDAQPLRKVAPSAPADIETICAKCLTRELSGRFETAKHLSDELGRFQRGEPLASRPLGPLRRAWKWAKRNPAVSGLSALVALTLILGTIISSSYAYQASQERRRRAFDNLDRINSSEPTALPEIFSTLVNYRATVLPRLQEQLANDAVVKKNRIRMAILQLENDPDQQNDLARQMLEDLLVSDAGDFLIGRDCLQVYQSEFTPQLWEVALDPSALIPVQRRFRAAATLALFDANSTHWDTVAPDVIKYLVRISPVEASRWLQAIKPVRDKLKPELVAAFLDRSDNSDASVDNAAEIISNLFYDQVSFLSNLVPDATARQLPRLTEALRLRREQAIEGLQTRLDELETEAPTRAVVHQKTMLITAMIQLGSDYQWHQFSSGADPSVATELIQSLGIAQTPFELLAIQVANWESSDVEILASAILSLGQFNRDQVLTSQIDYLTPTLLEIFSQHPSSRVHSSARWLLVQWGMADQMLRREKQLRRKLPAPGMGWHVDLAQNTFAIFEPVNSFEMGLNKPYAEARGFDPSNIVDEPKHNREIPRRFGICIHEITIDQYDEFRTGLITRLEEHRRTLETNLAKLKSSTADDNDDETAKNIKRFERSIKQIGFKIKEIGRVRKRQSKLHRQLPIGEVDFVEALSYCRWLSETQQTEIGLPSVIKLQEYAGGQKDLGLTQKSLNRTGYRLPTAAEWEYACRGQTKTIFPFGSDANAATRYAWFASNSQKERQPIGQLMPGATGLFDAGGNVSEWCLDWYKESLPVLDAAQDHYVDFGPEFENHRSLDIEFRGGSYLDQVYDLRATKRFKTRKNASFPYIGIRLARTYPASDHTEPPDNGED